MTKTNCVHGVDFDSECDTCWHMVELLFNDSFNHSFDEDTPEDV